MFLQPKCSSYVGNTPVLFYGKHTYLFNKLPSLIQYFATFNHCFFKHRRYCSLSCTKDDLNIHSITLTLMKTYLAEDNTQSSYKKNDVCIAFYNFFSGDLGPAFFHSPCSLQLAYSHCMLHTVFPHNYSVEKNTKLGILHLYNCSLGNSCCDHCLPPHFTKVQQQVSRFMFQIKVT